MYDGRSWAVGKVIANPFDIISREQLYLSSFLPESSKVSQINWSTKCLVDKIDFPCGTGLTVIAKYALNICCFTVLTAIR